ncbi:hypothetical protein KIW84_UN0850 [Lathyrus oleraceus]|nr:hypothetical protein KIW84_UN0850 [Pisum sativum]
MFDADPLAKSLKNERHCHGEFSMASIQSNKDMEDHNQVDVDSVISVLVLLILYCYQEMRRLIVLLVFLLSRNVDADPLAKSLKMKGIAMGILMASIQSNKDMEDHNQVDVSHDALFV